MTVGKTVHSSSPNNTALGGETHVKVAVRALMKSLMGNKGAFTTTLQKDFYGLRELSISGASKLPLGEAGGGEHLKSK